MKRNLITNFSGAKLNRMELKTVLGGGIDLPKEPKTVPPPPPGGSSSLPLGNI